ncbi:MAG TPA: hypothetical protein VGB37_18195 [Candidatus Lokiarchaeia archaeon]
MTVSELTVCHFPQIETAVLLATRRSLNFRVRMVPAFSEMLFMR